MRGRSLSQQDLFFIAYRSAIEAVVQAYALLRLTASEEDALRELRSMIELFSGEDADRLKAATNASKRYAQAALITAFAQFRIVRSDGIVNACMSGIVDNLVENSLATLDESFAHGIPLLDGSLVDGPRS